MWTVDFEPVPGKRSRLVSIREIERSGLGQVSRLPVCLRLILESVARNVDGRRVREEDVRTLASWKPRGERRAEIPFVVARVLLQDFTGVPLLVDLAAMRSALARVGEDPEHIEPLVPVELVIDHSVQVDWSGRPDAEALNERAELRRNEQRYEFLKWGSGAFSNLRIVPPGVGICHQVNLEYFARGVIEKDGLHFPDTLVGTDSHTTMINGIGVLGWGVGGIEAEAAMLGEPVALLEPDVVGVRLEGALRAGATATDLVLHVTETLRRAKVVGKLVEFHGEGAASLASAERATIANMAPEYGATAGFFPVDEETLAYFTATGRSPAQVAAIRSYHELQGTFGIPRAGDVDYSQVIEIDLSKIGPSLAGPKRPQDRIELAEAGRAFREILEAPPPGGYGRSGKALSARIATTIGVSGHEEAVSGGGHQEPDWSDRGTNPLTELEMVNNRPTPDLVPARPHAARSVELGHGSIVIAAITSCTNTSNPGVMLAAGLLAKKAVARGLKVPAHVKTSLAPGSRAVTEYLRRAGLLPALEALGFAVVGYGCTTCIGNSGPLDPHIERAINAGELVAVSVLSGNRNFEARIHQSVRANYLMSPPLVVAFALAGRIDVDLEREPLGKGSDDADVFLRDIWPTLDEVRALGGLASDPALYAALYAHAERGGPDWQAIPVAHGKLYEWSADSTYIREPPYFEHFAPSPRPLEDIVSARALAVFGDSITTDHISPAGAIKPTSPAGEYLRAHGVSVSDFNTYGARRGNHEVMIRGTFANVRIRNLMTDEEGGRTVHHPGGEKLSIFDAAERYAAEGVPLVVFAGFDYGAGSSRDWAAKGTRLLGVRAVIARSFERIHRSNLLGMGVLPLEWPEGASSIRGDEVFSLRGIAGKLRPRATIELTIDRGDRSERIPLRLRADTPIEVEYLKHGGILPLVLRERVRSHAGAGTKGT